MRRYALIALATLTAVPAFAQSTGELADRLSRLERDLNYVQRQVYTTKAGDPNAITSSGVEGAGAAQINVRLTQIEEQMRQLRGQIEQANYAAQANGTALQKFQGDVDYRLQALEQAQSAAASAAASASSSTVPSSNMAADTSYVDASVSNAPAGYKPSTTASDTGAAAVTGGDFPNSNAHYNYAFKQLNAKKFSEAASSFDDFVKKYPKDPLTSNAYYWLGESYYARGDYTRAAEGFRKGFESNPAGQKAPDNLLKLAMSLEKIKRMNDACVVLKQVTGKFGESAPRTAARAEEERARMACK